MLLQEEQYIIHWLTEYGPLPQERGHAPRNLRRVLSGGGPHVPAGSAHDPCRMGVAAVH